MGMSTHLFLVLLLGIEAQCQILKTGDHSMNSLDADSALSTWFGCSTFLLNKHRTS